MIPELHGLGEPGATGDPTGAHVDLATLVAQPSMPHPFSTRVAELADLDAIMELEHAGFAAADRWSREAWRQELTAADRIVLLIGADEGVITLQVVGELADLLRMTVAPDSRGRSLGRMLVAQGIVGVVARGAERLLLEVEDDNRAALAVYTAMGFTEIDRRVDYYGSGRDALIMEFVLMEEPGADD